MEGKYLTEGIPQYEALQSHPLLCLTRKDFEKAINNNYNTLVFNHIKA